MFPERTSRARTRLIKRCLLDLKDEMSRSSRDAHASRERSVIPRNMKCADRTHPSHASRDEENRLKRSHAHRGWAMRTKRKRLRVKTKARVSRECSKWLCRASASGSEPGIPSTSVMYPISPVSPRLQWFPDFSNGPQRRVKKDAAVVKDASNVCAK